MFFKWLYQSRTNTFILPQIHLCISIDRKTLLSCRCTQSMPIPLLLLFWCFGLNSVLMANHYFRLLCIDRRPIVKSLKISTTTPFGVYFWFDIVLIFFHFQSSSHLLHYSTLCTYVHVHLNAIRDIGCVFRSYYQLSALYIYYTFTGEAVSRTIKLWDQETLVSIQINTLRDNTVIVCYIRWHSFHRISFLCKENIPLFFHSVNCVIIISRY